MSAQAPDLKENLLSIFKEWISPILASYEEPTRAGTPKGDTIGLSKKKFYAANLMILYDAFTLNELAKEAGVSHDQIRRWRTESQFMNVSTNSLKNFAVFIINKTDNTDDPAEYRNLLNCLMFKEDIHSIYSKELFNRYLVSKQPVMISLKNLLKFLHLNHFRAENLSKKNVDRFDAELARMVLEWSYTNLIQYLPVDHKDSLFIVTILTRIFRQTL